MQGLVLTSADNLTSLLDSMRANSIPLLKVVTGWGVHWDSGAIRQACAMQSVLVRTVSGDGGPLNPDEVLREIEPWYTARPQIQIELGNEPNSRDTSEDAAWVFRSSFIDTLNAVRERYPQARIVSPGLKGKNQENWWRINQDAFNMADSIGFHAYAFFDFTNSPAETGDLPRALQQLGALFPNKPWIATELGINDMATPPSVKAARYAALHRRLPGQVAAAIWYHFCDQPIDNDQRAYQLPISAFAAMRAGASPAGTSPAAAPHPPAAQPAAVEVKAFAVIDPCSDDPASNFANVREEPKPTGKLHDRLRPGALVLIDTITGEWGHLAKANPFKDMGFVSMGLLRKTVHPYVVIDPCSNDPASNFANIHQAPDARSPMVPRTLDPGTAVLIDTITVGTNTGDWAHLAKDNPDFGNLGFVKLSLLRRAE